MLIRFSVHVFKRERKNQFYLLICAFKTHLSFPKERCEEVVDVEITIIIITIKGPSTYFLKRLDRDNQRHRLLSEHVFHTDFTTRLSEFLYFSSENEGITY